MTAEQLVEYLIAKTGDEVDSDMLTKFQQQKITGLTFLDLKESDLKDIIPLMGERKAILQLQKLTCDNPSTQQTPSFLCIEDSEWMHQYKHPDFFSVSTNRLLSNEEINSCRLERNNKNLTILSNIQLILAQRVTIQAH